MCRVLIFDMDDTLVASGETWVMAETRVYRRLGHAYDPRIAALYKGCNAWQIGRILCEQLRPEGYTPDACGQLLRALLLEEFRRHARAMPGADLLLRRLAGRFPLAIASGSPVEAIRLALQRLHWEPYFDVIVSSESVARGKPEPDVFLETAARCGCAPHDVLVIEDSLHGVRAAKRAGMACFAVPSSDDPAITAAADRVYPSLDAITIDEIEGIFLCTPR